MNLDQRRLHAQHKLYHKLLYDNLRELVSDWYLHTGNYESAHTVSELLDWARDQSNEPTWPEEMSGH